MSVNHTHGRFAASSTTGSVFGSAATAQNDDAAAANGGTGAGADAGGDAGGDDTPTVMEIVAEFKKQKISGTVPDKRALLKKVVNCRDVLVKKLAEYRSPEVADAFRKSTWDEAEIQKQKHKADDLSKQLIMIAQILETIKDHYEISGTRTSREPEQEAKKVLDKIVQMYADARSAARLVKGSKARAAEVNISALAKDRKFCQNGSVPVQEEHRLCISCRHKSVDEPDTNKANFEAGLREEKRVGEERKNLAAAKAKGEPYRCPRTNKVVSKIVKKKVAPCVFTCHCHQMGCKSKTGPVSITDCSINCIDTSTGERYPFDLMGCTCPVCKCKCDKVYRTDAHQDAQVSADLDGNGGEASATMGASIQESAADIDRILERNISVTLGTALKNAGEQACSGNTKPTPIDPSAIADTAVEYAAREMLTSHTQDSEHKAYLDRQRKMLGVPSTIAQLPGTLGKVDARLFGSKSSSRMSNNRLSSSSAASAASASTSASTASSITTSSTTSSGPPTAAGMNKLVAKHQQQQRRAAKGDPYDIGPPGLKRPTARSSSIIAINSSDEDSPPMNKKTKMSATGDDDERGIIDVEAYITEQEHAVELVELWTERLMDHCFAVNDQVFASDSLEGGIRKDAANSIVRKLCSHPDDSRTFVQGWLGYCERNGHSKTVESLFDKYNHSMLSTSSDN